MYMWSLVILIFEVDLFCQPRDDLKHSLGEQSCKQYSWAFSTISIMLRASKWNDLPPESFDLAWAKLPLLDLCRARLVCKAWNRMIREPYIKSLRLQIPRQPSCMLIMPKMLISTNITREGAVGKWGSSWGFFDMTTKRVYKLSHDGCIFEYINVSPDSEITWNQYTLAMDKNLMYVVCEPRQAPRPQRHIICEPVTKACHDIPPPPTPVLYTDDDIVVMAVDHATPDGTSYQIIRMEQYFPGKLGNQEVQVYNSTTKQWTILTFLPAKRWSCSNTFWRGAFYTLIMNVSRDPQMCLAGPGLSRKLCSYDFKTGRWSLVHVTLPPLAHPRDKCQLVVAAGRMFMIEFIGPDIDRDSLWDRRNCSKRVRRKYVIKLTIWEVILGNARLQKVAEMPKYPKYPGGMVQESLSPYGEPVVAVGCGNSIVVSSWIGRCVAFDLVRKNWHELPISNEKLQDLVHPFHQGIFTAVVDF